MVTIDPAELSGGDTLYIRKPYAQSIPIAKKIKLPFIRGIISYVLLACHCREGNKIPLLTHVTLVGCLFLNRYSYQ